MVLNVSGLSSHASTLWFDGSTINFTCGGTPISVSVPAACIKFDPTCSTASTSYNAASNCWVTVCPIGYGGNVFSLRRRISGSVEHLRRHQSGHLDRLLPQRHQFRQRKLAVGGGSLHPVQQ